MSKTLIYSYNELQSMNFISNSSLDFKLEELNIENSIKYKLKKSQIDTVKLLAITPSLVLRKTGLQFDVSVKLIRKAQEFLKDHSEVNKSNLKQYSGITTGCQRLDSLLGGGIKLGQLFQIFGESGTGKTQLAHQLCINVQLPYKEGGIEGHALFLDVDGTFRPERIIGMTLDLGVNYRDVLWNITVARALNSEHQMSLIRQVSKFKLIKKLNIKLIVIDSLMGHFRSEYMGKSNILKRQKKVDIHMHDLKNLQKSHNELAVLFTNQVTFDPIIGINKPCGGGVVFYNSDIQIELQRGRGARRIAKIVEAPYLPDDTADFTITHAGVRDY